MTQIKDVIALFPGQGSQSVPMGADLYENFKCFRDVCEEASDTLGYDMARLCFQDPDQKLNLTEFTQPALLTMGVAAIRTLAANAPFRTLLSAGHSLGEYTALVHEGALRFSDALKAVRFRGQAMQNATPVGFGAMAAYIGNHCADIEAMCARLTTQSQVIEVVNFNSPSQLVVSGHTQAVKDFCHLVEEGRLGRAIPLSVSAPFHSSLMAPAAKEMATWLNQITLGPIQNGIVANIDAQIYQQDKYAKDLLVQQLAGSVKWTQSLQTMHNCVLQHGKDPLWVEFGPGSVLKGLVKKTLGSVSLRSSMPLPQMASLIEELS